MRNLVIIGNGFDLAHGLKTSYKDFVRTVIEDYINDQTKHQNIFKSRSISGVSNYEDFLNLYKDLHSRLFENNGIFKNDFFELIFDKCIRNDWCDVEQLYFDYLNNCTTSAAVKKLNDEFEVVKKTLASYLVEEQKEFKMMKSLRVFFERIKFYDTVFLNFNYTDTVKRYLGDESCKKLIHIHGELNDESNPIIFGYAAYDEECNALLLKGDNYYLKNIKKINYKNARNEEQLFKELGKGKQCVKVFVWGHSCGLSDKLILSQIFNHERISSIVPFYFKDKEGRNSHSDSVINIQRIMSNATNSTRIASLPYCFRMPQHVDSEDFISKTSPEINDFVNRKWVKNDKPGRWATKKDFNR